MTLPDVHLAEDALAAYVDGVLSPAADERAGRHLRHCAECRAEVDAQREAKALIAAAPDPVPPAGLLAKLLDVPMTADLGGGDQVLAVDGNALGWAIAARPEDPRRAERSRTVIPSGPGIAPSGRRPGVAARPAGASGPGRQPRSPATIARGAARLRRRRRGLAVSLAGLAFGVIASAASSTAVGTAAPPRTGPGPGSTPAQLIVRPAVPLDMGTLRFSRPATGVLVATAPER